MCLHFNLTLFLDGQGDDDKDYFDDNWEKIRSNTISILQTGKLLDQNVGQEEIRFLTFAVADIVNNGQSDSLTSRLRGVMDEYVPKIFDATVEGENCDDLVDRVYRNWTDFKRKLVGFFRIMIIFKTYVPFLRIFYHIFTCF